MGRKVVWKWRIYNRVFGPTKAARRLGVSVGEGCRILSNPATTEPWLVSIGDRVTISSNVRIVTHDGSGWLVRDERGRRFRYAPVRIGSHVFVGANSTIMPGVRIGDRCVVGAGSVVTRSIPEGYVAAGVPARIIGTFEDFERGVLEWPSEQDQSGSTYRERVDSIVMGFQPDLPPV